MPFVVDASVAVCWFIPNERHPIADAGFQRVRLDPAVTSVLLGPRTPKHLESSLEGAGVRLDAEILDRFITFLLVVVDAEAHRITVVNGKVQLGQRLKDLWTNRDLLILLTRTELKVKYKNSVLGYVWSMLNPALVLGIYYVIFKVIALTAFVALTLPGFDASHFKPFMPYGFNAHVDPDGVKRGVMASAGSSGTTTSVPVPSAAWKPAASKPSCQPWRGQLSAPSGLA